MFCFSVVLTRCLFVSAYLSCYITYKSLDWTMLRLGKKGKSALLNESVFFVCILLASGRSEIRIKVKIWVKMDVSLCSTSKHRGFLYNLGSFLPDEFSLLFNILITEQLSRQLVDGRP